MQKRGKKIFSLLAAILQYPTQRTIEYVCESITVLEVLNAEAKRHLDYFREFCLTNPLNSLQEIHTGTFDLEAACCPYVGYYLFDKDHSRKLFMTRLIEHYNAHITSRNEMPDHITSMLRSLVVQESAEEAQELIDYCLIPAVKKMVDRIKGSGNPYQEVLQAVLLTLETEAKRCVIA